ncbi:hypothetical protein WA158_005758 [Blastocystis sp. Blastoise]
MEDQERRIDQQEIRLTADDAASCKYYAAKLGYFKDNYIKYFIRQELKRPPLINRGYYCRCASYEFVINNFLSKYQNDCSIINLGAGFDTLYFRLKENNSMPSQLLELDMKENIQKKLRIINKYAALKDMIPNYKINDDFSIQTDHYSLFPCDLTNIHEFEECLKKSTIDSQKPVLILSECVLIYIDPDYSDPLIQFISDQFSQACFLTYEQIMPSDAFGRTMVKNLNERGCPLLSLEKYPTLEDQKKRYISRGFTYCDSETMHNVYYNLLPMKDVQRATSLEFFDEYEEWLLIQTHYCLTYASKIDNIQDIFPMRHNALPKLSSIWID